MMAIHRSIAMVVEGIGSDATQSGGIAWTYGHRSIAVPQTYEWLGGAGTQRGLVSAPQSVGATVNPFDSQVRGSAQTFALHADATAKALWLNRPVKAADTVLLPISKTATTITLSQLFAWSSADDGEVVWIGDEAIRLGTHDTGGTFDGCTRGYWSTTPGVQPRGMNVFVYNPFRINRGVRMLTYDHDTDAIAQVWQGFVDQFSVDNAVLTVQCRDLLSPLSGAPVNRGKQKRVYVNATEARTVQSGAVTGYAAIGMPPLGYSGARVNKTGATKPHWMALQWRGALVYARRSDVTDQADLIDADGTEASGSKPALGSRVDPEGHSPWSHEVLVVDRDKDQAVGVSSSYATMRSSTRDLQYPFHPVAISMALLTSGYATTPGVAGTGAEGDVGIPTAWTYTARTQYYTVRQAKIVEATNLDGYAICSNYLQHAGGGEEVGPKLIPADGGAAVWTMDTTGMSTTLTGRTMGVAIDAAGAYAYVHWASEDGTFATAGRSVLQKLDVADGTPEWTFAVGITEQSAGHGVVYMDTWDHVFHIIADSADEITQVDGTTKAEDGDSNDSAIGTAYTVGRDTGEAYLIVTGSVEQLGFWDASGAVIANAPDWELDLSGGVDSTLGWTAWDAGNGTTDTSPRVSADRLNTGHFFVSGGQNGANGEPYIFKGSTVTQAILVERDCSSDTAIPAGTWISMPDHAVDKDGRVYCLLRNNLFDVDIVVLSNDLTTVVASFDALGLTLPVAADALSVMGIAVDEAYNVYVTDSAGYVWFYAPV